MKLFLASLATLLVVSCATSPESYLAAHPDTPANIASSLRQGDVIVGMTREQARIAWGAPSATAEWTGGDSWLYYRSSADDARSRMSTWGSEFDTKNHVPDMKTTASNPFSTTPTKPRRMLYFRGDQVVNVEKAPGEL